jgi:hypothetical protein
MVRQRAAFLLLSLAVAGCGIERPPGVAEPSGERPSASPTGVVLAPPSYRLAPMPVSPTWEPPGADARPVLVYTTYSLRYPVAELELIVTYEDPAQRDVGPRGERTPVTMLGVEAGAYVVPFGHNEYTVWSLTDPDGKWVVVSGTDPDVVRRFAQGLRREPTELAPPFEVALLPEGFVPIRVDPYTMEFALTNEVGGGEYVSIQVAQAGEPGEGQPPGTPVTVGGHPAEIFEEPDGSSRVVVRLPGDITLTLAVSAGLHLDRGQILQLAEGVTMTRHAIPFAGNP